MSAEDKEKQHLKDLVIAHAGNLSCIAQALSISVTSIRYKLKKYDLIDMAKIYRQERKEKTVERLKSMLERAKSKTDIAKTLGLTRMQVYRLMDRHNLKSCAESALSEFRALRDQCRYKNSIDRIQSHTGQPRDAIVERLNFFGISPK